ncbi:MAG TPA: pyridine nucleotide-disulfide oxidoreductase, partial [Burkholderiaceae bacterium]|nr:pyridine nucleotide-disulfide oxidoreductase [Burkholderiaceae bacterium]
MKTKRLMLLLLVVAAIAAFFVFDLGHYLSLDTLKLRQQTLQEFTQMHPWQSAAAFFLLYTVATALSVPGAAILTLAAG